ncbi:unnamed protein product [Phyllotreta striolata]|uniref:Uncharacterized protein n=1 Tax=Phyllotreta striolata TaxID=444603 RepID=A0A9N9XPZ2_PHYSR|nr:unnamed protein product [Phyllotreta striolata]
MTQTHLFPNKVTRFCERQIRRGTLDLCLTIPLEYIHKEANATVTAALFAFSHFPPSTSMFRPINNPSGSPFSVSPSRVRRAKVPQDGLFRGISLKKKYKNNLVSRACRCFVLFFVLTFSHTRIARFILRAQKLFRGLQIDEIHEE